MRRTTRLRPEWISMPACLRSVTVVELNAVGDVLHVLLADGLVGPHLVDFLLDILGVGELGREVTIVGEQEHTSGVAVQTSHGIDAFLTGTLDEVHNGLAAVGVVAGGDAILGLIEQDVALLLGGYNLSIVFHNVLGGDFHAEFGSYLAVDLDETLLDVFIGYTTRADAGVGHELVQADLHVGIDSGLLIDDALGLGCKAHLGLGTLALGALLIAALLALLVAALTLLVAALLALLVATLLALLVTTLTLLVTTLTLLVTALTLLVTALTLLVATLTLLVAALALLVAALLALLVAALTLLVTTLALLIAALTLLIASLLVGRHVVALGISVLLFVALGLLISLLITGLVATLMLVATLTGLITTLTGLVATLSGLIALTVITALTGLITFLLVTIGSRFVLRLLRLMGAILYFLIATAFQVLLYTGIALSDSGPFGLFQIFVHRLLKIEWLQFCFVLFCEI